MAASEEQVSKFSVTIPDNILDTPTIRLYDEDEQINRIRDGIREKLYEEIKNEIIIDIQSGCDRRQEEIVNDIDNALITLRALKEQAADAIDAVEEAQSTNDRYFDAGDFV